MRKLVLVAFLAACVSSAPPPLPGVHPSLTYQASFDEVWSAAIVTLENLRVPVSEMERDSGYITSAWDSDELQPYMDCRYSIGWLALAPHNDWTGRVTIFIRTLSASAHTVTVNPEWNIEPQSESGEKLETVRCATTGVFEQRFHATMQQSLD